MCHGCYFKGFVEEETYFCVTTRARWYKLEDGGFESQCEQTFKIIYQRVCYNEQKVQKTGAAIYFRILHSALIPYFLSNLFLFL